MSRHRTIILSTACAAAIMLVAAAAYTAGVAAGRASASAAPQPALVAQPTGTRVAQDPFIPQAPQVVPPAQMPQPGPPPQSAPGGPPQIREFVPLPGPGDQQPGQRPGQQQGDCEPIILFYHNGRLYQLRPGPGPQNGPGRPTAPPEFYQLNPYQGPPIPGLPIPPQGPGFAPVNPRS